MDIEVTIITSNISTNMRDVFIPLPSRRWISQYVNLSAGLYSILPGLASRPPKVGFAPSKSMILALLALENSVYIDSEGFWGGRRARRETSRFSWIGLPCW